MQGQYISPDSEWYFGEISRQKTNEILLNQPVGTFLIRDSTTKSGFALSIKESTKVIRYLINYCKETNNFKIGNLGFDSLEALLDNYCHGRTSACFLVKPAPKERLLAMFDFTGEKEGDLTLSKGDLVTFLIQKKDWIMCASSDCRRGWVPANYLAPYNAELLASLKVDKENINDLSYCSLASIISVPIDARVVRKRRPSMFQSEQLEIDVGDSVRVERAHSDGNCEVWHRRLQRRGFVPISFIRVETA